MIVVSGRRGIGIGLGGYPAVGLAEARSLAAADRIAVSEGRDPVAEKRRPPKPTFKEAAHQVHEANRPRWRNAKHAAAWIRMLDRFAFPCFGNMPVDCITRADVLSVLTPVWGQQAGDCEAGAPANPDRHAVGDGPRVYREQPGGRSH